MGFSMNEENALDLGIHAYEIQHYDACSEFLDIAEVEILNKMKLSSNHSNTDTCKSDSCSDSECAENCRNSSESFRKLEARLGKAYDYHHFCEIMLGNNQEAIYLAEKALEIMKFNDRISRNIEICRDDISRNITPNKHIPAKSGENVHIIVIKTIRVS